MVQGYPRSTPSRTLVSAGCDNCGVASRLCHTTHEERQTRPKRASSRILHRQALRREKENGKDGHGWESKDALRDSWGMELSTSCQSSVPPLFLERRLVLQWLQCLIHHISDLPNLADSCASSMEKCDPHRLINDRDALVGPRQKHTTTLHASHSHTFVFAPCHGSAPMHERLLKGRVTGEGRQHAEAMKMAMAERQV
ncbi:hypothetical protein M440DRAFT_1106899 [Trichoderma longibrachiatum ATCC 18648]|uniref:Uncharacterized protein n=1 Tax=Trichoderma longibrachiatum ATCC 18648 TaxID=983965 RepID=A0A2T4CEH7_TRILO|nr:hypothetical protein M440DRAFT_1106899 [Trichoderma longibrachiatum ATCC 18648]